MKKIVALILALVLLLSLAGCSSQETASGEEMQWNRGKYITVVPEEPEGYVRYELSRHYLEGVLKYWLLDVEGNSTGWAGYDGDGNLVDVEIQIASDWHYESPIRLTIGRTFPTLQYRGRREPETANYEGQQITLYRSKTPEGNFALCAELVVNEIPCVLTSETTPDDAEYNMRNMRTLAMRIAEMGGPHLNILPHFSDDPEAEIRENSEALIPWWYYEEVDYAPAGYIDPDGYVRSELTPDQAAQIMPKSLAEKADFSGWAGYNGDGTLVDIEVQAMIHGGKYPVSITMLRPRWAVPYREMDIYENEPEYRFGEDWVDRLFCFYRSTDPEGKLVLSAQASLNGMLRSFVMEGAPEDEKQMMRDFEQVLITFTETGMPNLMVLDRSGALPELDRDFEKAKNCRMIVNGIDITEKDYAYIDYEGEDAVIPMNSILVALGYDCSDNGRTVSLESVLGELYWGWEVDVVVDYDHAVIYADHREEEESCEEEETEPTEKRFSVFPPEADPDVAPEKPVIYLYPEKETEVSVQLDFNGELTSTYPAYGDGWNVIAQPDGTLTDPETGREYYCLFWEGISYANYDLSEGFVVAGEDTESFLEDALKKLGLTDQEANEFIIYWLPRMEHNAYNLISFQGAAYTESAVLTIDPAPDTLLRVFMVFKPLAEPIEIPAQELTAPERTGFTVVEWGGAEIMES